ncbi:LOW QUALITY PROTEIN: hypothetical protein U9M48_010616 [Paspalum notatum var. saurae]|uniref:Uncharacterized protein n=1 Tax=Paspalum notatum var. saurae TaxID=547442 RepID=A0AAQ3WGA2_PASNO
MEAAVGCLLLLWIQIEMEAHMAIDPGVCLYDGQPCSHVDAVASDVTSARIHILMRGPSLRDAGARRALERQRPGLDLLVSEQPRHLVPDLLLGDNAPLVGTDLQAGTPQVADVTLVHELVGEGQQRNGVPFLTPSMVEFQPQCDTKHATEGCESTRCWGAQPTTSPLPATRRRNSPSQPSPTLSSAAKFGRTTHRNGRPVSTSPSASSWIRSASNTVRLPNATYTTEPGACASSQGRQLSSCAQKWPGAGVDDDDSGGASSGPMASGGAKGRSASARDSISWNVLQTMSSSSILPRTMSLPTSPVPSAAGGGGGNGNFSPVPHTSQTSGTPLRTASIVEFQPQCDTKHATEGCASTRCCWHQLTMRPRGAARRRSCSKSFSPADPGLTTHRNGREAAKLPDATYTTELAGCASSHAGQEASSAQKLPTGLSEESGPMGRTLGKSVKAPGSSSWMELQTMVSARCVAALFRRISWKMIGWPLASPARFHENSDVSMVGIAGASWNVPRHLGQPSSSRTPPLIISGILNLVANVAAADGQNPATRRPSFFATGNAHAMFTSAINQPILSPPRSPALIPPMSFLSSPGMTFEKDSVRRARSFLSSPQPRPSGTDAMSIPPSLPSLAAKAP